MNVLVFALGSHGDVHPFVGIGIGLRRRGHRVAIATNEYFQELVEHARLEFLPLGTAAEYRELVTDPGLFHPVRGPMTAFRAMAKLIQPEFDIAAEFARRDEVVVLASSLALGARIARDTFGFPLASVHVQPVAFQSSIAPPRVSRFTLFPDWMPLWGRRMTWRLINTFMDSFIAPAINDVRTKVGLPKVRRILETYWHSPDRVIGLFPEWYAKPQADWPAQTVLTGFPMFDEPDLSPISPELEAFLQSGERPIACTPGSAMWNGKAFFEACVEACETLGRRGLLLTRHRGHLPTDLPAEVMHVHYAPFSRLLPRCAAFVHHGGIGTSAQAMASATPQLVTPFSHDQPDNAARMEALGIARSISAGRATGTRAAGLLSTLIESPAIAAACRDTASRFVGVDATSQACDVIERLGATSR